MNKITISEHGRIARLGPDETPSEGQKALTAEQFERLQLWDERTAKERGGELLFDWRARYVKAKQYVGVIQWRDVLIEVLPKVSSEPDEEGEVDNFARGNLRVMLEYAHDLKVEQRGVAQQDHDDAPLSEFLIRLFARQLRGELFKGLPHGYREHEEQRSALRGKLVLPTHLRTNAARADRFYVRHEEFTADVALNRAFKAAARALVRVASSSLTRELLGECVSLLDDVSDVDVRTVRWEGLVLDRKVARFGPALTMARLLTQRQQTTGKQGQSETFALMYPMNALYEQFMAGFLRREVLPLLNEELDEGEEPYELIAQGSGLGERHLFPATDTMKSTGLLKPDLMIRRGEDEAVILDTKWKHLTRHDERGKPNPRDGIGMDDLYQMVVYGHVFDSPNVLLVYPEPADKNITKSCYKSQIQLKNSEERVSVKTLFIPMGQELSGYPDEKIAGEVILNEYGERQTTREWLAKRLKEQLLEVLELGDSTEEEEELNSSSLQDSPSEGSIVYTQNLSDAKFVSNTKPISIIFEDGKEIKANNWSGILRKAADVAANSNKNEWENYVNKTPFKTKKGREIIYVSRDSSHMRKPYALANNFFVETHGNANTILKLIKHFLKALSFDTNKIKINYRKTK